MPYVFAIKITGLESYRANFRGTIPQYHTQTTTMPGDLRQALHEMWNTIPKAGISCIIMSMMRLLQSFIHAIGGHMQSLIVPNVLVLGL